MSEMNIYQRINEIRKTVEYVKRGSAGQGTGVLYDEVISFVRQGLIDNGVLVITSFKADQSRKNDKGNYIYEGFFHVKYQNIDDKEDFFIDEIVAHAMDAGDKAPGKAITYATKISMLKVFSIETGINDESRAEQRRNAEVITDEQIDELTRIINGNQTLWNRLCKAFKINSLQEIPAVKFEDFKKAASNGNNQ